jgi:hypothetical protein
MKIKILFVFLSMLSLFAINTQAQTSTTTTTIEKKVIVTPVPKSAKCTTVGPHWEGEVWVDTQTICTYENRVEGVAWVQDYWACTTYNVDTGACTAWEYKPGYWVKTLPN